MPVDTRMRSRHARVVDAVGRLWAAPEHHRHLLARKNPAQVEPDEADAVGFGSRLDAAKLRCCGIGGAAAAGDQHPDRLGAAAQGDAVEAAKARLHRRRQAFVDIRCDQGLVVAGMVEQACRDVDRIAKTVARHLDDFAARQGHLQAQPAQPGRCAALVPARNHLLQRFVHAQVRAHPRCSKAPRRCARRGGHRQWRR